MAASLHILYDGLGPASRRAEGDARVDLAAEQDFMIAALKVSPSTREVFDGGARDVLEPRVMMVLVALARADGATVSRDKLIQSCWDGLAVSDDAINRVIGRLRRLAASSGAFSIETITKVGYRLHAADAASGSAPVRAVTPGSSAGRSSFVPVLAAAAVVLAGLGWWGLRKPDMPQPQAAVAVDRGTQELIDNGRRAVMEHVPQRVDQGIAMLREAVLRAPGSADAWGALALGYAHTLTRTPHERQPEMVRLSEAAVARALSLDPDEPMALAARARLIPIFGNWQRREQAELAALKSGSGKVEGDFRGRFLLMTGRLSELVPASEKARSSDPSLLYPRVNLVQALWGLGRVDEADQESEKMLRLFPGNYLAWFHRFYFLLYSGRLAEARAMVDNKAQWPDGIPPAEIEHAGRMVAAIEDPAGPAARAIEAEYVRLMPQGRGYIENAIRLNAALGRPDEAFRLMEHYYLAPTAKLPAQRFAGQRNYGTPEDRLTELLFVPPVDRLHADPRFLALLTRIGLADYWRTSGTRPDLCDRIPDQCSAAGLSQRQPGQVPGSAS